MGNPRIRTLALAAAMVLLSTAGVFAQQGESTTYGGHTYTLFDSGLSWEEAKRYCEEQGGHLATISSRAEQKAIATLMKSGSKKNYWIGGSKAKDKTNRFVWITGEKFSFIDWDSGAPSDSTLGNKNCMRAYRSTGRWSDENGDKPGGSASNLKNYGFICEWEDGDYAETVSSVSSKSEKSSNKASETDTADMGISIDVGDRIQLFAPSGTKWVSSDPSVVKVNSRGLITGVAEGTAVITARGAGSITVQVE